MINEFGEVGLDHHLIERIDETTILLQSGCVCCTIRGELSAAIRDLFSKREQGLVPTFDRLVIESTGLADPFPILSTVRADPVLSHHFTLGNVVTLVDAVNAESQLARYPECARQIASADRLVLSKTDLVPAADAHSLRMRLAAMNPAASLVDVHAPDWTAGWLVTEDAASQTPNPATTDQDHTREIHHVHAAVTDNELGHTHHDHDPNRHGDSIRALALTIAEPLDWTTFGIWLTMLLNRHGKSVLRVKAILNLVGETRPVAVHGVQHLVHPPVHMAQWPSVDRSSRLVFIVDGIEESAIRASLAAFAALAPPALPAKGDIAMSA
ncbi:ATP-binding protein [Aureimonas sp. SA4125]|uniref:CobW family GTP-binding protein n=1 Tax=Aureimonas sp. SA4125 TaxID=2826993 RepID=UPI001E7E41A5|nr:GTP-binding protein [Aureimonas sp. SA4125]BDA85144.1 ATP-binding protein [Aureimonas sp. SA4125]